MTEPNGYVVHMIGHGHIDPTWLWRWTEGYEEVRATFRSALDRMNETPGLKFTASSACFYDWVKACDPEMFEAIRARVAEGRWDIAGGWWIEPDCNIPGGESFVRHGLYAQRFFEREFGKRVHVGFNPDSFGHAGTLPQIYKKLGIDFYVFMRPSPPFEINYPEGATFWWQANDGTRILACNIPESYNADVPGVKERIARVPHNPWLNRSQRHVLAFYGVGNHGGGPTKQAIAAILDAQQDESMPHTVFSRLDEYFAGFLATTPPAAIPTIATDLQHHARGCYSVHSAVKRLNRQAEHALMAAERFASVVWLLDDHPYPKEAIINAWKDLLYNQFHDILAGSSIELSYEDMRDQTGAARHTAHHVLNEAVQVIARDVDTSADGNTAIVVNPLPWAIRQTVTAPPIAARLLEQPLCLVDEDGRPMPHQTVRGERVGDTAYAFTVDVPALGYRSCRFRPGLHEAPSTRMLEAERDRLENDWWLIEFDPYSGEIRRLLDKKERIETLHRGNILACMIDQSDTWSHGYDEWRVEAGRFGDARLELIEAGAVRATVRIIQRYGASIAQQFVTLHRDVDTIDCRFRINWQERFTMLKLAYETNVAEGAATCDTAYGCQTRNTAGFEEPGQKWIDLTGRAGGRPYGFAILNDSKYGFDVRDNVMRLTLLRSPVYAHHDRTRVPASELWPAMDQGWHNVHIQLCPHPSGWQTAGVVRRAWELNEPAFVHMESAHKGTLPGRTSFLEAAAPNVVLTILKQSEEGDDLIVRGYETAGEETACRIALGHWEQSFEVTFHPHEIKTLRINRHTWECTHTNLLEEPV
jgi:alpha-mannosidase